MTYKIINSNIIKRIDDNTFISTQVDSPDYQAYLKWLEEGNTVLPADEPTQGAA